MKRHFKIEFFESPKLELHYPKDFTFKQKILYAGFGSALAEAELAKHPEGKNIVSMSTRLRDALAFPEFVSSVSLFEHGDTLCLGPLIGIFTSGFTPKQLAPIGSRSDLFANQMSVQRALGAVPFLFGEEHIDWENGIIHGCFCSREGWVQTGVPFPNAVFDRLPIQSKKNHMDNVDLKQKFENDYLIPWYHPGFFQEPELFEKLFNDPRAEQFLPETHPFISFSAVERMIHEYGHVFLKQDGEDTCYIVHHRKEGIYYCRLLQEKKLLKFKTLESFAKKVFGRKDLEKVLVQQGIRFIRHENKAVNFHVIVADRGLGSWEVKSVETKYFFDKELPAIAFEAVCKGEEERTKIQEKLEKTAIAAAEAIEGNLGGVITKIELDLAIDTAGKIWLLKAASHPDIPMISNLGLHHSDYLTRRLAHAFSVQIIGETENALQPF